MEIYRSPLSEKYFVRGKSTFIISIDGIMTVSLIKDINFYSLNWNLIPQTEFKETREKIFKMFQLSLNF